LLQVVEKGDNLAQLCSVFDEDDEEELTCMGSSSWKGEAVVLGSAKKSREEREERCGAGPTFCEGRRMRRISR